MSTADEEVWRQALQRRGRDWVLRELNLRPGQPDDAVYDVVFEEPYPTRAFCRAWCAEQDNQLPVISGHTIAILVAVVVLVGLTTMAVSSLSNLPTSRQQYESRPQFQVRASVPSTPQIEELAPQTSAAPISNKSTLPASCAYMTYETADCKFKR